MNATNARKLEREISTIIHRDVLLGDAYHAMARREHEHPYVLVTNAPADIDPAGSFSVDLPATWAYFTLPIVEKGRFIRHQFPRRQIRIVVMTRRAALRGENDAYSRPGNAALVPSVFVKMLPDLIASGQIKRLTYAAVA
jgi:hypothetical protein